MNWTMPYPWRSRRDSVRRINMSSEPGNESFFCALRPIPRILSLRRQGGASQVQINEPSVALACSPPLPLEEHNPGRYRYIKRRNFARHRNADQHVAVFAHLLMQPFAFAAK